MATIVRQGSVIDGYDVRLDTGEVLHFSARPGDVAAAVDALLQAREAARLVFVIGGEE